MAIFGRTWLGYRAAVDPFLRACLGSGTLYSGQAISRAFLDLLNLFNRLGSSKVVPDAMGDKWNGSLPALGAIPRSLGCSWQMSLAVAWCSCKSCSPPDPLPLKSR